MSQSSPVPRPVVEDQHPAILLPDLDITRRYRLWWSRHGLEWFLMDEHAETAAGNGLVVSLGAPIAAIRNGNTTTVERAI